MSYNAKWGGTIPFPKDEWESYICDVIILAKYRKQGYGTEGIQQLCKAEKKWYFCFAR